jgi:hypothetical protein
MCHVISPGVKTVSIPAAAIECLQQHILAGAAVCARPNCSNPTSMYAKANFRGGTCKSQPSPFRLMHIALQEQQQRETARLAHPSTAPQKTAQTSIHSQRLSLQRRSNSTQGQTINSGQNSGQNWSCAACAQEQAMPGPLLLLLTPSLNQVASTLRHMG